LIELLPYTAVKMEITWANSCLRTLQQGNELDAAALLEEFLITLLTKDGLDFSAE